MTKPLTAAKKKYLKSVGQRVKEILLHEMGYTSFDAVAMEFPDEISKPTLYKFCDDIRDIKLSTLLDLCEIMDIQPHELLKKINYGPVSKK